MFASFEKRGKDSAEQKIYQKAIEHEYGHYQVDPENNQ